MEGSGEFIVNSDVTDCGVDDPLGRRTAVVVVVVVDEALGPAGCKEEEEEAGGFRFS